MRYTGANTSQPHVSKVLLENLPDGKTKVIVRVAMSGGGMLGETGNSMKTTIVKVCDSAIIEKLSKNIKAANIELIENAREEGKFGNLDLSIAEVKHVPRGREETAQGYYITNVEFVFDNIVDLTFYLVCQHNANHPKFARIASSKHFKRKVHNDASIAAEDVFHSGRLVNKSKAFVYDDTRAIQEKKKDYSVSRGSKRIWTGPVGRYSSNNPRSDGYVGYVARGLQTEEPMLKLAEFPNATIHDYRILEKISNIPFNCKIKESDPSLINQRRAYFSNLCITGDGDGFVKMFFAVDIGEIVKDNVKIPRFISIDAGSHIDLDPSKNSYEDVINLSLIKSMVIRRHEIDNLGNILSGGEERFSEKIIESSQKGLKLSNATSRTSYPKNDEIDNIQTRANGSIKEVDNLHIGGDNKNIRFFTVTDSSMRNKKHGNYRYSVGLDIEDGSIVYLQELHKSLKKGLNAFQTYHHSYVQGRTLDKSYFIENQGPWVWTLNILIKTIRAFQEDLSNENLEEKLYILASPNTCTLESLGRVVKTYEKVLQQVKNIMDELPTKSKRDTENMKANSVISGARRFPLIINLQHTFADIYEPNGGRESGYHYLPSSQTNIENNPGLLTINNQDFIHRTTEETLRYFTPTVAPRYSPSQLSSLTPMSVKVKNSLFPTFVSDGVSPPTNNAELANFNALISLYNFKKYGTIHIRGKDAPREAGREKMNDLRDNLYANQLSTFSHHVKNNLSNAMSSINVVGAKKYESPCFEKTEQQEKEYAKLMMSNTTSAKYKAEISSRGVDTTHAREEVGETTNLSSIFAPLFYMKQLNIYKELSCLLEKMNTSTNAAALPNQLQALLLKNRGGTTHQWYDADGNSSLKTLDNAAFHYLNNKNLVNIEVLTEFDGGQIKSPVWTQLRETHINEAATNKKTNLLCRLQPYSNENICFIKNDFLELNIFNQCFLLDVAQVSVPNQRRKINRKAQSMGKITSLDKNDFLKLESALMRTNLLFGQVVKQDKDIKRTKTTAQRTQTQGAASNQSPMGAGTTGPRGGSSGGGMY